MISSKSSPLSIDEIKAIVELRGASFDIKNIYILPEGGLENEDFLNEHSPDIYKALTQFGKNPVYLVKKPKYKFIELRSAEIILPLIIGIPFSILANLLTDWLKEKFVGKKISVKVGRKTADGYEKIEIEGHVNEVIEVLNTLKG